MEFAPAEAEQWAGRPPHELAARHAHGSVAPLITVVTDNGGPFRSVGLADSRVPYFPGPEILPTA